MDTTALAVRSTKHSKINAELIETSYCNYQGIPYIQYLLTLDEYRLNHIMDDLGLSKFKGDLSDMANIINLASLLGWDRNKARNFCRKPYLGNKDDYLRQLLKYVCGYDYDRISSNHSNYKNTERYRYLKNFGDNIFIALYLVYFYYSSGIIETSREMKISNLYEDVVNSTPKIYEPYIINFFINPGETLSLLQMVPSGDTLTYFLKSISQYEKFLLNPIERGN